MASSAAADRLCAIASVVCSAARATSAMLPAISLLPVAAWLIWVAVHLFYLVGFKNRLTAVLHWAVSFLGRGRSERVSTLQQAFARQAVRAYGDPFRRERERTGS